MKSILIVVCVFSCLFVVLVIGDVTTTTQLTATAPSVEYVEGFDALYVQGKNLAMEAKLLSKGVDAKVFAVMVDRDQRVVLAQPREGKDVFVYDSEKDFAVIGSLGKVKFTRPVKLTQYQMVWAVIERCGPNDWRAIFRSHDQGAKWFPVDHTELLAVAR